MSTLDDDLIDPICTGAMIWGISALCPEAGALALLLTVAGSSVFAVYGYRLWQRSRQTKTTKTKV